MGVGGCHYSELMSNGEVRMMEEWSSACTMQMAEQCLHNADSGAVLVQCRQWNSACIMQTAEQCSHSADGGAVLAQWRQWSSACTVESVELESWWWDSCGRGLRSQWNR